MSIHDDDEGFPIENDDDEEKEKEEGEGEIEMIVDKEWLTSLEKKIAEKNSKKVYPEIIRRVPETLKKINRDAYEPTIISLGPYHHNNPRLQEGNELKWHFLNLFLYRNRSVCLADYLKQIKALEPQARQAYSELVVEMSSKDFVEMLLLDGCFVVEIILRWNEPGHPFRSAMFILEKLVPEILMLENQLPFFLIQTLFDLAFPYPYVSLSKLVLGFIKTFVESNMEIPSNNKSFHHILHFFHSCIIPAKNSIGGSKPSTLRHSSAASSSTSLGHKFNKIMNNLLSSKVFQKDFLLPINNKICCCFGHDTEPGIDGVNVGLDWIPSATKLNEAGVHFKRKEKKKAKSFLDITFQNGKMEIPQLVIDDRSEMLLRNLIAFEQCMPWVGYNVTAYASFMDCIIDTAADVELLQQVEIIVSGLGHSKEVATLFNELFKEVYVNHRYCYLSGVFMQVKQHLGTKCNKWKARLNHDYFSNPWAIISLLAAFFLFILATTQTIYTVLGYVKPPK